MVDFELPHFKVLEHFTDRTSSLESVNGACKDLFCKRNKTLENLPPNCCKLMQFNICISDLIQVHFVIMQDALLQHVKHAVLQTGIWTTCREPIQNIPSPVGWRWSEDLGSLSVVWMTIAESARPSGLQPDFQKRGGGANFSVNIESELCVSTLYQRSCTKSC